MSWQHGVFTAVVEVCVLSIVLCLAPPAIAVPAAAESSDGGSSRRHLRTMNSASSSRGGGLSYARLALAAYNSSLARRPLLTKVLTGVVGTCLGDALAQWSSHYNSTRHGASRGSPASRRAAKAALAPGTPSPPFQYDWPRLFRLVLWSAAVGTPLAHFWFEALDTRVMPHAPVSARAVAIKLSLDQCVMAPIGTALFLVGMKVLEGRPHMAIDECKSKLAPIMLANWCVWPLANAINFAFIAPPNRILYVNVLAVAWSAFMSDMACGTAAPLALARSKGHYAAAATPRGRTGVGGAAGGGGGGALAMRPLTVGEPASVGGRHAGGDATGT